MRRTVFATLAVFIALVPAAGAAEPRIAAGVSAAGTDVSGLTLAEAAGKLYNVHGFSVGKPLSTHVAGRKFAVTPSDLGFVYDVNKTARRAYNAGKKPHTDARLALDSLPPTQVELIEGVGHHPQLEAPGRLLELLLPIGT